MLEQNLVQPEIEDDDTPIASLLEHAHADILDEHYSRTNSSD